MKIIKISLLAVCAFSSLSHATVSLTYQFGGLFDSTSNGIALGSYGIVVADTGGDGFLGDYTSSIADFSAFAGTSLTYGSALGGSSNDIIIGVFAAIDGGGGVPLFNSQQTITLTGGLSTGNNLGLYWFPSVSTASIAGSVDQYGFFRTDSVPVDSGSDMAFVMPADSANFTLAAFSQSALGGNGDITDASFTAVAVPEPSTYVALLGALALGFVVYRRRRS